MTAELKLIDAQYIPQVACLCARYEKITLIVYLHVSIVSFKKILFTRDENMLKWRAL